MSTDHEEITASGLQSLHDKPALNTPPLIAIDLGIDREEAERSLEDLRAQGKVRQTVMGWKLPRAKA